MQCQSINNDVLPADEFRDQNFTPEIDVLAPGLAAGSPSLIHSHDNSLHGAVVFYRNLSTSPADGDATRGTLAAVTSPGGVVWSTANPDGEQVFAWHADPE